VPYRFISFISPVACPVCYVSVDQAFALMPPQASPSPVLQNLYYVSEDSGTANFSNQGSVFGGHVSLDQRNKSFDITSSMTVNCGYVTCTCSFRIPDLFLSFPTILIFQLRNVNTAWNCLHCLIRFVRGKKPGQGTGFDISDDDLLEMEKCRGLVVASAIFGTRTVYEWP
jgi:hypothetical protein